MGRGARHDDVLRAIHLDRAVDEDADPAAMEVLGYAYAEGWGVTQDYDIAVRWDRRAAGQGETDAQIALGLMYEEGWSVTQDYVQAHMWYNLAAAQGQKVGRKYRNSLAKKMTPAQIAEAQKLAREWKPKRSGKAPH